MQSHLIPLPGKSKGGGADDALRTEPIGVYLYKRGNETQRRRELKIQASVVESKQAAEPKLTQKSMRMMMSVEKVRCFVRTVTCISCEPSSQFDSLPLPHVYII